MIVIVGSAQARIQLLQQRVDRTAEPGVHPADAQHGRRSPESVRQRQRRRLQPAGLDDAARHGTANGDHVVRVPIGEENPTAQLSAELRPTGTRETGRGSFGGNAK